MPYRILLALVPFVPSVAFAAETHPNFADLVDVFLGINQLLVLLIFALTFLVLAWTVIRTWIIGGGDEHEVESGKRVVTIGIIALVVMSGIWGILALLRAGIFGYW
jgi:hypothetical protein